MALCLYHAPFGVDTISSSEPLHQFCWYNSMERVSVSTGNGDYQHTHPRVRRSVCAGEVRAGIAARARSPRDRAPRQRTEPQPRGHRQHPAERPRRRPTDHASAPHHPCRRTAEQEQPVPATGGKQQCLFCLSGFAVLHAHSTAKPTDSQKTARAAGNPRPAFGR